MFLFTTRRSKETVKTLNEGQSVEFEIAQKGAAGHKRSKALTLFACHPAVRTFDGCR